MLQHNIDWSEEKVFHQLIGRSEAMQRLRGETAQAARGGDRPILIVGEVGVGKTHVARYVHEISPRCEGPLVFVDCGSVSDLENLLFGHRAGAFTGAVQDMGGRLKAADHGILVLDDVERLSHKHQDLFHRVVVDGVVVPLGANRPLRSDVRVVATTNKDLTEEVRAGRLKRDFVSRLDYFVLRVPPLRDRLDDLPGLAEELLKRNLNDLEIKRYREPEQPRPEFHPDCWPAMKARKIEDNIRGLDKMVVRLLAHIEDRLAITPDDIEAVSPALPPSSQPWFDQPRSLRQVRESFERDYIRQVLHHTGYNITQAARILDVSPKHVYTKLKQYGIPLPSERLQP